MAEEKGAMNQFNSHRMDEPRANVINPRLTEIDVIPNATKKSRDFRSNRSKELATLDSVGV